MGPFHLFVVFVQLALFVISTHCSDNWPAALKRCNLNDADLDKCLLEKTKSVIPLLAKGIPEIGLPPMDPLKDTRFELTLDTPIVSGSLLIENATMIGLCNAEILNVTYDKKKHALIIESKYKRLDLAGDYKGQGKVVTVDFDGHGIGALVVEDVHATHIHKFSKNTKNVGHGKVLYKLHSLKSWKVTKMEDKVVGESISSFIMWVLNVNVDVLWPSLAPSFSTSFGKMYEKALKPLTEKFPVSDFFLGN